MPPAGPAAPMNSNLGPDASYVADTGPLLCIGGSSSLRSIFVDRSHGKTHWVEAVRDELIRHSRGRDPLARAANIYNGRGASWLTAVVQFSNQDDQDLNPIKDRLKQLAEQKAARKGRAASSHPKANLGEAQSILHSHRNRHTLLAHDDDARRVARENQVPAATLVDLARQLVAEGTSAKELATAFLSLQRDDIDTGEHIGGQLDLRPRPRPRRSLSSVPRSDRLGKVVSPAAEHFGRLVAQRTARA